MRREERELILRQGVARPELPKEREQLEQLHADLRTVPARGRPVPLRLRNFRPNADAYLAALGGPLPYMVRLREIAEMIAEHERTLQAAWLELAQACGGDAVAFERRWREVVDSWRFDEVNDLVERHNRNYPAESRLPMDPRTRDFVRVNGEDYRRRPLDATWALALFPASLELARSAIARSGAL